MITKKFGICVRTLLIINILFGFVLYSQSAYSDVTNKEKMSDEKNFQGKWIVRDVLDLAPILPIEEAMVNSLPGKVLEISDGLVSFVEYKCASPKLKFSSIQTASFFRDYKMDTPKNLPKFVKADRKSVV